VTTASVEVPANPKHAHSQQASHNTEPPEKNSVQHQPAEQITPSVLPAARNNTRHVHTVVNAPCVVPASFPSCVSEW
jgi:hypothetical protein